MHPSNSNSSSATAAVLIVFFLVHQSSAAVDSFVYVGCSQAKFTPGTPYENSVDSILTSLVNSASYSSFNKFTVGGSGTGGAVYGLFQCRPDLSNSDCSQCVARSVSQLGVLCANSAGAVLQLDGCLVRYDDVAFLGVEDKSLVSKKCGPQLGYGDSDELTHRDSVLGYLDGGGGAQSQLFRVSGSGNVQGVAECVGDLSAAECQDCLGEAIGRLKSDCGVAAWGDVYLAKCYARYSIGGSHAHSNSGSSTEEDETEKTLAILIGLIAVVAIAIIFLAFLRKLCDDQKGTYIRACMHAYNIQQQSILNVGEDVLLINFMSY
ncbi:hypothetical protein V2J09_003523 [Rumex salicifolius]